MPDIFSWASKTNNYNASKLNCPLMSPVPPATEKSSWNFSFIIDWKATLKDNYFYSDEIEVPKDK